MTDSDDESRTGKIWAVSAIITTCQIDNVLIPPQSTNSLLSFDIPVV
jgi:hypothetical protein